MICRSIYFYLPLEKYRKFFIPLFLLFICLSGFSQTVFWTENFGTCGGGCASCRNTLATAYPSVNGSWSLTDNSPGFLCGDVTMPNEWFVSSTEAGMGAGNCGDGCLSNGALTNQTLHVANIANSPNSAFFSCTPGDCGAGYDAGGFCDVFASPKATTTDKRIQSPTINCTGRNTITLSFIYFENGQ